MICSKTKIEKELEFIKKIFCNNGYPFFIMQSSICAKITQFYKPKELSQYIKMAYLFFKQLTLFINLSISVNSTT